MHAIGVTCENDLTEIVEKEKRYVAWKGQAAGRKLADDLAPMVEKVLLSLSAPRLMRWGNNDFRFVRPVRGVLMMHGKHVIGGTVMNVAAGKTTKGHPILTTDEIVVASADDYENTMREKGMVIVNEVDRRYGIVNQLEQVGGKKEYDFKLPLDAIYWVSGLDEEHESNSGLLHEVAGMCEYPVVYEGEMHGAESLPDFCVIGCIKKHQRFFPVYDTDKRLNRKNYFVVVDNMPKNSAPMIAGFDSVLRARLCDLSFYYNEDKKHSAEYYLERLKAVVYHAKLGSQYDRVCRIQTIARDIAKMVNLDDEQKTLLEKSAKLCKADLATLVVGEYPDFEGKMAAEYFCDGTVADIVRLHNEPAYEVARYFDAWLPAYWVLLLADNLEKLVGMMGIGEKPTGSKDPHGLRSVATKIMFVLRDAGQQLAGDKLLQTASAAFDTLPHFDLHETWGFIAARMPFPFSPGFSPEEARKRSEIATKLQKSVLTKNNFFLTDIHKRLSSMDGFARHPEAEILIAAGKRINNIFRKSGIESISFSAPDVGLFEHESEHALHRIVGELTAKIAEHVKERDYSSALKTLAFAAKPADDFFEKVMVNAEDEKVRHNRFALLHELRTLLNCVGKLS